MGVITSWYTNGTIMFYKVLQNDILFFLLLQAIGAVNTIVKRPSDGKLIGYNTDYVGAISAIEDGLRGVEY